MGMKQKDSFLTIVVTIFVGICLLVIVCIPLFAPTIRYQLGSFFSMVFYTLGTLLIFIGTLFLVFGILSFFTINPGKAFKYIVLGIIFLSIAGVLLMPGSAGTNSSVPKGYH
jgi:hypothetical protein